MIPKNKKLYCKACEEEFVLDTSKPEDYKIVKRIRHNEKESSPIVMKEGLKSEKISPQDRKAYEEFFGTAGSGEF